MPQNSKVNPRSLLGDDLYSRQPMAEHCLESGMNFIFTCLPESHTALYDWLDYLERLGEVKILEISQWHKRSKEIYRYRYVNEIPLSDTQPTLLVNWCELTLTRQSDGKVLYQNAFITRHALTAETVPLVVSAGRSRCQTENENHGGPQDQGLSSRTQLWTRAAPFGLLPAHPQSLVLSLPHRFALG